MNRRGKTHLSLMLGVVLAVTGCGTSKDEPREPAGSAAAEGASAEALSRARAATNAMAALLTGTLLDELEQGGPAQAVRVCSEIAPALAAEQSVRGLAIRRVSLKVRNPADEPDGYERAVLEKWAAAWAGGTAPAESAEIVEAAGRPLLRYMRPITVVRPCLTCHGDPAAMEPDLKAALEQHYPGDRAIGYAEGDLRGAFSVTVELPPATP